MNAAMIAENRPAYQPRRKQANSPQKVNQRRLTKTTKVFMSLLQSLILVSSNNLKAFASSFPATSGSEESCANYGA